MTREAKGADRCRGQSSQTDSERSTEAKLSTDDEHPARIRGPGAARPPPSSISEFRLDSLITSVDGVLGARPGEILLGTPAVGEDRRD